MISGDSSILYCCPSIANNFKEALITDNKVINQSYLMSGPNELQHDRRSCFPSETDHDVLDPSSLAVQPSEDLSMDFICSDPDFSVPRPCSQLVPSFLSTTNIVWDPHFFPHLCLPCWHFNISMTITTSHRLWVNGMGIYSGSMSRTQLTFAKY